jgi:micrococcal nuclease
LIEGKWVHLVSGKHPIEDEFGYLAANVFVGDQLLNETLVREGLARVNLEDPNLEPNSTLFAAESEAKNLRRGIWGQCPAGPG